MACTTLLVGRRATNDGSTIVARNEDGEDFSFDPKKMIVVMPEDQPRTYTGVASHLTIDLPDNPLRYTCTPNADPANGVWAETGINAANVSMSATETISANARVLGADPLVTYQPAVGKPGDANYKPEVPGCIGEENLPTITLPYIKSAREGVARLGMLVEKYGTYETNGVAFGDADEVWYWENIGGHHWIARRVPDDCYVVQPNRQGIDHFDLADALGDQHDYMCSADLAQWIRENDLLMDMPAHEDDAGETVEGLPRYFNARIAFSTYTWLDQLYNAPRKWYLCSRLTPSDPRFAGPAPEFGPESLDIPWAMRPDKKLSASDVKDLLATTYDGTEYDPYGTKGTPETRHQYRYVGIDRTSECSILCIRPNAPKALRGVHWFAPASGPFNTAVALYANVKELPAYLDTPTEVTTDSLYWNNRLVAGLSDPQFLESYEAIQGYRLNTMAQGYQSLHETDAALEKLAAEGKANLDDMDDPTVIAELERANQALVDSVQTQTRALLGTVLDQRTVTMKNAFNMNDH